MKSLANICSGKKKEQAETPQEANKKLKDTLVKKQEYLEKKIETELMTAKKHVLKNKRAAFRALVRKKRCEKQLQQIDRKLTAMEFQVEAPENASTNTEDYKAMQVAAKSLKDIDKVHDVMDEIHEQQEIAHEIADAVSNPVGFGHDIDEDDLLAELKGLREEELKKQLIDTGLDLPTAPVAEPFGGSKVATSKSKQQEAVADPRISKRGGARPPPGSATEKKRTKWQN